jgi:hypothetical protein
MIAVIADDLSGAAEIANAALLAGLSAEVHLRFRAEARADVICVDTASRSLPAEAAAARVGEVARAIAAASPVFVYKKCDSVLRGSVAAECLAVARAFGKKQILLLPANPSRRRIIRAGYYFVDGVLLSQTALACDPEHPRHTSHVAELLGPTPSILTPDAAFGEDLVRFALKVDAHTLPAGAVDFFNALLATMPRHPAKPHPGHHAAASGEKSLYVCGSNAAWLCDRAGQFAARRIPIFPMPRALFGRDLREDILGRWAGFAAAALRGHGAALLAIGGEEPAPETTPALLTLRLAQAVELVLEQVPVARVFLEGGATATAVVRQLALEEFQAEPSPGPGIGALRPGAGEAPLFLIKPGSYPWPDSVWQPK